jgi:hypothetical protein
MVMSVDVRLWSWIDEDIGSFEGGGVYMTPSLIWIWPVVAYECCLHMFSTIFLVE